MAAPAPGPTVTLTFGEAAENHVGMEVLGATRGAGGGLTPADLVLAAEWFRARGCEPELIDLGDVLPAGTHPPEPAAILVVPNGARALGVDPDALLRDLEAIPWDAKIFSRRHGKVVNKHARTNLCFGPAAQEPDYAAGKGRVVAWSDVPQLAHARGELPAAFGEQARDLYCEGNRYAGAHQGIGFHGDGERRLVVALRLGAPSPIVYQWYLRGRPASEAVSQVLPHGALYAMSEKAVGSDWKRSSVLTLRHAAGGPKYSTPRHYLPAAAGGAGGAGGAWVCGATGPGAVPFPLNRVGPGDRFRIAAMKASASAAATWRLLDEHGFCVVPDVLPPEACDAAKAGLWDWLGRIRPGLRLGDVDSWAGTKGGPRPNWPDNIHGIFQHYRVGQEQAVWDVRQHPRVAGAFAALWGVAPEDLLVSFDGVGIMRPPEVLNARGGRATQDGTGRAKPWLHFDQGVKRAGLHCVQGLVNLEEVGEGDGTLLVWPGSHRHHADFMRAFGEAKNGDWHKLTDEQRAWLAGRMDPAAAAEGRPPRDFAVRVRAPKGSLVLWDSRVAHQNVAPAAGRADPDRWRYVVYVCMTPRAFAGDAAYKVAKRRAEIFEMGRMTNHWPHAPKLFPAAPRAYGGVADPPPPHRAPELTPLGRRLAGYPA